ncbi:MAG: hypothetical protein AB1798_07940 [Spirochaetota bacterium]
MQVNHDRLFSTLEERWEAIEEREPNADGKFFYRVCRAGSDILQLGKRNTGIHRYRWGTERKQKLLNRERAVQM